MNRKTLYLVIILLLVNLTNLAVAQQYVDGAGSCGGNTPCVTTIQAGINAASAGQTVTVYPGTYTENITINKSITLVSTGGRGSTTIVGTNGVPGTVLINGSTTGLSIGTMPTNGFTIIGVDAPTNISDVGAIYIQGAGTHTNLSIIGNDVRANGDDGFVNEPAAVLTGFVFDNNILSGQTFTGVASTNPNNQTCCSGSCYFDNTSSNVARPLFALNPSGNGTPSATNVQFTNNMITGVAGAGANGNILVLISATNALVQQNTFAGTTVSRDITCNRGSLRVRGSNFTIDCNQFNKAGLSGAGAFHILFDQSDSFAGGNPSVNTLAEVAQLNNYDTNPVAYFDPVSGIGACAAFQRTVFVNMTEANLYNSSGVFAACGGTVKTVTGSCQTPLPVELTWFRGTVLDNQAVELSWQTATERNNSYFDVQHGMDAEAFTTIGRVSGKGNTYKLNNYKHTDNQPALGTNYYRLKQVDLDGKATYSQTIAVIFRGGNFLTVYPNPATDQVSIQFKETIDIQSVSVYDQTGRMLRQSSNAAKTVSLQGLTQGIYHLEIKTQDGQTYRKSIIKQ